MTVIVTVYGWFDLNRSRLFFNAVVEFDVQVWVFPAIWTEIILVRFKSLHTDLSGRVYVPLFELAVLSGRGAEHGGQR